MLKLHLGSGGVLKEGWQNIDAMYGHHLPGYLKGFGGNTVDAIFSEHFIEHLTRDAGLELMRECYRILKPGAPLEFSCPDLAKVVQYYLSGRVDQYGAGWQPKTPCQLVNEGLRSWGHLFVYDGPELLLLAEEAGFTNRTITGKHSECVRYDFGDVYLKCIK